MLLRRETVRNLTSTELPEIAGGTTPASIAVSITVASVVVGTAIYTAVTKLTTPKEAEVETP
jgi:hypothetical protein